MEGVGKTTPLTPCLAFANDSGLSNRKGEDDMEITTLHVEMRAESWSQREARLAEGRSSPTGWPITRLVAPDDGISIPKAPLPPWSEPDDGAENDALTRKEAVIVAGVIAVLAVVCWVGVVML